MAVTAAALTFPTGRLKLAMFPGDDAAAFTARLNGYIAQAGALATADGIPATPAAAFDAAVTARSYCLGYTDAFAERADRPTSASLDNGAISETYAASSGDGWLKLAGGYCQEYTALRDAAVLVAPSLVASGWASLRSLR